MAFSVRIRQSEKASLVYVTGRLTSYESQGFREAIQRLVTNGNKNIVLILTDLEYLDSFGELVGNYLTVVKKGRDESGGARAGG